MKLIFPFTYIDQWHYNRYKDQFEAYAREFEEVTIPVQWGVYPENDIPNLKFSIWRVLSKEHLNQTSVKIKNFVKKITLYQWVQRYQENQDMLVYFLDSGIEGDVLLSYSGTGLVQTFHCDLAECLGIPAVYRMRGDGVLERSYYASLPNRVISNYFHFESLKRYDAFIPINEEYRQRLLLWGVPNKLINAPIGIGVDVQAFKRYEYPDGLTVGFFGRLSHEKNLDFMFEVMRQTPNIQYLILGKNILKINAFPRNCKYLGYVAKKEMPEYYNKINVLINPSLSEGLANVVLEAYATKTPVIGSPATFPQGLPVYGCNLPVHANAVQLWASTLNRIDSLELKHIGGLARSYAESISWLKFGKNMAKVLKQVERRQRNKLDKSRKRT